MQMRQTMWSAGKVLVGALALGMMVPSFMSANVGGVVHVPSGRLYVQTGSESTNSLRSQAVQACGQKELAGDKTKSADCAVLKNFAAGPCDAKYGKGNQYATVGGYSTQPKAGAAIPVNAKIPAPRFNGFIFCGKTQQDADHGFTEKCGGLGGCSIWQHYNDSSNQ